MPRAATKSTKKSTKNARNTGKARMVGTKGGEAGAGVTNRGTGARSGTATMGRNVSDDLNLSQAADWSTFQPTWMQFQNQYGQLVETVKQQKQQINAMQKQINQMCGLQHKSAQGWTKLYEAQNPTTGGTAKG